MTGSAALSVPERRYLTILFADLVGYTNLSEWLDPEDLRELQRRYQQLVLAVMERFGGFVASFSGDGVLVYFGYPVAHENDAERALRAALKLIERLPQVDTTIRDHVVPKLAVRIGVHTGLVVVGPELISAGSHEHSVVGEAVNIAARLQTEARPNSVVVAEETLQLVEGLFDTQLLGPRPIKGLSRLITVHEVTRARPVTGRMRSRLRGLTQMIGRKSAMDQILLHWRMSREESRCHTVVVAGEAGIGKTRLVMECCKQPELAAASVLQANCLELFASTPLYTVGSFLWARTGLAVEDDDFSRIKKISELLDELGLNDAENVKIVLSLLGLAVGGVAEALAPTPLLSKRKQFAFVVAAIKKIASRQPSLLWIEDVHWLDPSSAELLIEVVSSLSNTPCLVVLTMRSFPKGPTLPKADEVVDLEQLGSQECLELAKSVSGAQALSDQALLQAVDAAEGIPFFVEQLVLSLIDERSRAPGLGRHARGLPLTLAEMMSERLDRLAGGRRVVQAAACIGRSFTPQFLDALLKEDSNQVVALLEALVEAEILRASPYDAEPRYEFRHALLQRMAYESMVQSERRGMHARIVNVLKRQSLPTVTEVIAHHLTEAEQFHDAIDAWLTAGTNAARRSAHVEAIEHLRRGLGLLKRIPEPELRREMELKIQATLIGSVNTTQGATSEDFSTCCERGLQLCSEGAPTPLVFPFLFGKFGMAISRGRTQEATVAAERFLAAADRNAFGTGQVIGHRLLGMVLLGQGDLNKGREQLELSLQLYSPERDAASTLMVGHDAQVHSRSLLSLALFCLGRIDEALEIGVAALSAADALRHPNSTALALAYVGGWVFGLCGATEQLVLEARRLIAVSEQHSLAPFHAFGRAFLGWALCQRGDLEHGTETIQRAIESFDSINFRLSISGHLANLADAKRRCGRLDEANALTSRAMELIAESSQRWLEPEVRRIEAIIERDSGPNRFGHAEDKLRKAVLLAQRLGHPVFELRCLLSLRDLIGPTRQEVEIKSRLQDLAYLRNLDRQVDKAVQKHGLALTA